MGDRVGCVVEAGSTFTVAGTIDNVIHFWGTRNISPITRPNTQVVGMVVMTMMIVFGGRGDMKAYQILSDLNISPITRPNTEVIQWRKMFPFFWGI